MKKTPMNSPEATASTESFSELAKRQAQQHMAAAAEVDAAADKLAAKIAEARKNLDGLEASKQEASEQSSALRLASRQLLLRALAASAPDHTIGPTSVGVSFVSASLAGTRMAKTASRNTWSPDQRFELVPDPTNTFDPNAIEVWQSGKKVGFISKEDAAKLRGMEDEGGWILAGPAFLESRKGGHRGEGLVKVRLENPMLGWDGYNPLKSLAENLSAMETEILSGSCAPATTTPKLRKAL